MEWRLLLRSPEMAPPRRAVGLEEVRCPDDLQATELICGRRKDDVQVGAPLHAAPPEACFTSLSTLWLPSPISMWRSSCWVGGCGKASIVVTERRRYKVEGTTGENQHAKATALFKKTIWYSKEDREYPR
uniref:Uncharacterized protein n=1 Tax=Oryza glumipatula TaxID=40148 RepID=A0A0E0AXD5_9ORYZ